MKVLTLNDGTRLEVSDLSTFADIVNVFKTQEDAEAYRSNFTEDSLKDAYLGDEEFSAIPKDMTTSVDPKDGNVTAHYMNDVTDPAQPEPEPEPEPDPESNDSEE